MPRYQVVPALCQQLDALASNSGATGTQTVKLQPEAYFKRPSLLKRTARAIYNRLP